MLMETRIVRFTQSILLKLSHLHVVLKLLRAPHSQIIVDIGCGKGGPIVGIGKLDKDDSIKRHWKIGIDSFLPYIKFCKTHSIYDDLILGDARQLPFKGKAADVVLCLELVEHLRKEEGKKLVRELEEIAREMIIISTPVGFLPQEAFDSNILQRHRSEWTPQEFRKRGYKVRGFSGITLICTSEHKSRFAPFIYPLIHPIGYMIPELAFQMLCHKKLKNIETKFDPLPAT